MHKQTNKQTNKRGNHKSMLGPGVCCTCLAGKSLRD